MDDIARRILEVIDSRGEEIIAFGCDIFEHAEIGFKETRTAKAFADKLAGLGLAPRTGIAITGVKAVISNGEGPRVALMGELDALPIPNASHTNPETGAAHCCGHNAQLAGVFGAAIALSDPAVRESLCGEVAIWGVPAEECVDLEYRQALCERGEIGYIGGKCELIRLGELDDVDVVVGHHSAINEHAARVSNDLYNGFVCKNVRYIGKSAHAAGSPEDGIDALAASALAMHAIDAQRESFRDADCVRIHGFLSSAGTATNVVADQVTMQYLVRAANIDAIRDASYKFDRAIKSAAMATGCGVEIHTLPGYLPSDLCRQLTALTGAIETAAGADARDPRDMEENRCTGSTDFGDISHIKPLLQFNTAGIGGIGHHPSYHISDERAAYVLTAKIFALTAYNLLKDGGREAKRVRDNHTPKMTKNEYLAYMEGVKRAESMPLTPAPSQAAR